MPDIKISQITPVATTLADSDMFPGSKSGGGSERYTGALLKSEILDSVDDLSAETVLTDAMKMHIIDASGDSKSSTLTILADYVQTEAQNIDLVNYIRSNDLEKYVNFLVENNSSNPTYQIDVSADELQIGNIRETAFSGSPVTVDITTVGENGRSYSAAESSSWHYLWAIAGDGETSAFILDLSATTPDTSNIAAGYTEFQLVGWVNNLSGSFTTFSKEDYTITLDNVSLLSGGTATSATAVSLSSIIPDYKFVDRLYLNVNKTGTGNFGRVLPTTSSTFGGLYFGEVGALIGWSGASTKPKSSNIYYAVAGGADTMSINAREIDLKI